MSETGENEEKKPKEVKGKGEAECDLSGSAEGITEKSNVVIAELTSKLNVSDSVEGTTKEV